MDSQLFSAYKVTVLLLQKKNNLSELVAFTVCSKCCELEIVYLSAASKLMNADVIDSELVEFNIPIDT